MYNSDNVLQLQLKPSPSLAYNNLCAFGQGLGYSHTRAGAVVACLLPPQQLPAADGAAGRLDARKLDTQDSSLVQSVIACRVHGKDLLVMGNEAGLQVWHASSADPLFTWRLPKQQQQQPFVSHAAFVRGLAFTQAADGQVALCAGCSSGDIQVFAVSPGPAFQPAACLSSSHKGRPLVALGSAFQSRRGGQLAANEQGCELIGCDEQGNVCVWSMQQPDSCHCMSIIQAGLPCCSLAVRNGCVITARTDGCICMYGLSDGRLRMELVAHSRLLSAMDIHPRKDLLATVAEDGTLGVWELACADAKVACLLSTISYNSMFTGVAFCGRDNDDVAAVAYDQDALTIWKAAAAH